MMNSSLSRSSHRPDGLTIVVVGASGDLAKKKTYPSFLALFAQNLLPDNTLIWGYARSQMTHVELRQRLRPFLLKAVGESIVDSFLARCYYMSGKSYGDYAAWKSLALYIQKHEDSLPKQKHNRLFYMAIPPNVFAETGLAIKKAAMQASANGWSRLVIEKPFGRDLESCKMLMATLSSHFEEHHLYRIDHYLGKEIVQNLLIWRFANSVFETMWNRNAIQAVHISFKEPFGTEGRGGYFDNYGIIRDILQNHLLQVLMLLAMEAPVVADGVTSGDYIRDAKYRVLQSMPEIQLEDCLLGQYKGYSDDETIENKDTNCPTYAAVRCFIHTPRWSGVPFILEAGKGLNEHICEARIRFKDAPSFLFPNRTLPCNELVMRLQPNPSIFLTTTIKTPGLSSAPMSASMTMVEYEAQSHPDAYTRLLLDVLHGRQASFVRADELERSWEIFTPLLHRMEQEQVRPHSYEFGSTGPNQRERFMIMSGITQSSVKPSSRL
jgi:glucose-6-phosphate 1-dehydrogenase